MKIGYFNNKFFTTILVFSLITSSPGYSMSAFEEENQKIIAMSYLEDEGVKVIPMFPFKGEGQRIYTMKTPEEFQKQGVEIIGDPIDEPKTPGEQILAFTFPKGLLFNALSYKEIDRRPLIKIFTKSSKDGESEGDETDEDEQTPFVDDSKEIKKDENNGHPDLLTEEDKSSPICLKKIPEGQRTAPIQVSQILIDRKTAERMQLQLFRKDKDGNQRGILKIENPDGTIREYSFKNLAIEELKKHEDKRVLREVELGKELVTAGLVTAVIVGVGLELGLGSVVVILGGVTAAAIVGEDIREKMDIKKQNKTIDDLQREDLGSIEKKISHRLFLILENAFSNNLSFEFFQHS